jgi:hypothetical protein
MANSNGWGDGAANNSIGWGQGANNNIGWGSSHATSWAGLTDIVGLTTDADAQAFITAAAITDPTQQTAINNLVKGMKADGIWTKMKAIYPFVGGTASTHKWNLKDPRDLDAAFRLVFNGGWTHSSNGATPNGTNGYADTKFNANTNQSVNNFALSVYLRTANTNALVDMGAANSPTYLPLTSIEGSAIGRTQYCWDFTTSKVDIATTDSRGMWGVSRTGATTWQSFQRNTAVAKTTTTSQTTLPNLNIYVGASNLNTGASAFSNREVSFAQLSNGLTNAEFNNLYTRVQAFQTSLSRQV